MPEPRGREGREDNGIAGAGVIVRIKTNGFLALLAPKWPMAIAVRMVVDGLGP